MTCKKEGCGRPSAQGQVYCSIECSPYGIKYRDARTKPNTANKLRGRKPSVKVDREKLAAKITELLSSGYTRAGIAYKTGVSYDVVSKIIRLSGLNVHDLRRNLK